MTIETYPDQLEPENQDAVIWRFISMAKFQNLIETGELYFCRADLFYVTDSNSIIRLAPSRSFARASTLAAGSSFAMKPTKCGRNTVKVE
jgi:hypothetical protein